MRKLLGQIAKKRLQRSRVTVEGNENKPAPRVEPDWRKRMVALVESNGLIHFRRAAQPSVQLVCPTMIGAHDHFAAAVAFKQLRAAMTTRIGESTDLTVIVPQHDQRNSGKGHREIVSGLGDTIG